MACPHAELGHAVASDRNVDIPWSEVNSFDGALDPRGFYEATLPVISRLHRQAAAHPSGSNELRILRQRVGAMPAESVCDLGCGWGDWASVYGLAATRIHLVDLSPSVLACAMEHVPYWAPNSSVSCQVLDLFNKTDWSSLAGYRMYLLAFVFGHATEPQRKGVLGSLRKLICAEDRVVLIDSLKSDPWQDADTVRCVNVSGNLVGAFKHYFDPEEVLTLGRQAGFELTSAWWGRRYFLAELR